MAHIAGITVAALAAVMVLSGSMLSAAAADTEELTGATAATVSETTEQAGEWVSENDRLYYIYADGNKAVGEVLIEGVPYLFGYSGALKIDWQTVGGRRYYYDPATGQPVFGWVSYFDEMYYVDPELGKVTGFYEIDGARYAFSEDGSLLRGEFELDDVFYYSDPETGVLGGNVYVAENNRLVKTDEAGAVAAGWVDPGDGRRFYIHPESYEPVYGLTVIDGEVYYITPEDGAVRGTVELNGIPCHFDEETCARTSGWFEYDGARCYFDPELQSTLCGSFADIDGKRYYFDENGRMVTGLVQVNDALYCFGADGVMQTGTVELDGVTRQFGEDGAALEGWVDGTAGRQYYSGGVMATGWTEIDGALSCFDANGVLCTGLTELEDGRYYLDENGRRMTGWIEIDGTKYYFRESGIMAVSVNLRIDGVRYVFDENGAFSEEEIPEVLDVISYKQTDPRWKSASLGGSTIGSVGCLVTSMAMLHSYTTGVETTPVQMRDMLKFSGGGGLASWSLITDLGYTVETYSGGVTQANMKHIYELLRDGKPVVLGCKKGSSGMHFVIVTGYKGDGVNFSASDFTINDPGYSSRFTLANHLAEYSSLYKLIY
ncbi:MAG: C39 family peptidase [Oscillospiraceae bacterium]|nr:C39 family peptidase [Oscillospiraceae bacterium]